jgi:hypothetical protein
MKRALFAVAMALLVAPVAAHAGDYKTMEAETGCKSKASDEKKADVFKTKYDGQPMTITGKLVKADSGKVMIKTLRDTLSYDISVELTDSKATYNLEKDQTITVAFIVSRHGGCFLPYGGKNGVLQ